MIVIGNGLIARAFKSASYHNSKVLIYSSGVSNSNEINPLNFSRESELVKKYLAMKKYFVYFSTCSINDPDKVNSAYVRHKMLMESLIMTNSSYLIIRLPQVVGLGGNKNTLVNKLYDDIKNGRNFNVCVDARRNLIDINDVLRITLEIIPLLFGSSRVLNIASPYSIPVIEIVEILEKIAGMPANYNLLSQGGSYSIDISDVSRLVKNFDEFFPAEYTNKILTKYYSVTKS